MSQITCATSERESSRLRSQRQPQTHRDNDTGAGGDVLRKEVRVLRCGRGIFICVAGLPESALDIPAAE